MIALQDDHQTVPDGPTRRRNQKSPPLKASSLLEAKNDLRRYMAAKKAEEMKDALVELFGEEGEDENEEEDEDAKATREALAFLDEDDDTPKVGNGVDSKQVDAFLDGILLQVTSQDKSLGQQETTIAPANDYLPDFQDGFGAPAAGDAYRTSQAFEDATPAILLCEAGQYSPTMVPYEDEGQAMENYTCEALEYQGVVDEEMELHTVPDQKQEPARIAYTHEVLLCQEAADEEMQLSAHLIDMEVVMETRMEVEVEIEMDIDLDLEHYALSAPPQYIEHPSLSAHDQDMHYAHLHAHLRAPLQLVDYDIVKPNDVSCPAIDDILIRFAALAIFDPFDFGPRTEVVPTRGVKRPLCGGLQGKEIPETHNSKRQRLITRRVRRTRFDARVQRLQRQKAVSAGPRYCSELAFFLPTLPLAAIIIDAFTPAPTPFTAPPPPPPVAVLSTGDAPVRAPIVDVQAPTLAPASFTALPPALPVAIVHLSCDAFLNVPTVDTSPPALASSPAPLAATPAAMLAVVSLAVSDAFAGVPECLRYREPPKRENGRRSTALDALAQAKADRRARKAAEAAATGDEENEDPAVDELVRLLAPDSAEGERTTETHRRSRAARPAPYARPKDEQAELVTPLPPPPKWLNAQKILGMFARFSGRCMDVDRHQEQTSKEGEEMMEDVEDGERDESGSEDEDEESEDEDEDDMEEEGEVEEGEAAGDEEERGKKNQDEDEENGVQLDEGEAPAFSDYESDPGSDSAIDL